MRHLTGSCAFEQLPEGSLEFPSAESQHRSHWESPRSHTHYKNDLPSRSFQSAEQLSDKFSVDSWGSDEGVFCRAFGVGVLARGLLPVHAVLGTRFCYGTLAQGQPKSLRVEAYQQ